MNWVKIEKWLVGITGAIMLLFLVLMSTPSILQVFSLMLFVLTIGQILENKGTNGAKIIKYVLYITYSIYSLWTLNIFLNLENVSIRDINKILFGVIAPICLVVVGKLITHYKIKGHKIFNHLTLWVIFLIIAIFWDIFYPEEVLIEWLIIYWIVSLAAIYYFKIRAGGRQKWTNMN